MTHRIACLDGLRGIAALWVVVGHALLLTYWRLPIISEPDLGVDLFIMLSGFLMVFQYKTESWSSFRSIAGFWCRRFFRIAPLFYVLLALALLLGPYLYEARMQIDAFRSVPPQEAARFLDSSYTNIMLHLTFLFGLSPGYAMRTPLPDWSLGLEMQFYLLFPFLMMTIRKAGWARGASVVVCIAVVAVLTLARLGIAFPMPSFLPLKMHVFLCGMLCAASIGASRRFATVALFASMLLIALPIGGEQMMEKIAAREVLAVGFYALILRAQLGKAVGRIVASPGWLLESTPLRWAGELSYGVYLLHLIIMQPVVAALMGHFGHALSPARMFADTIAVVVPVTYLLSYVTYRFVEKRGQEIGRRVMRFTGFSKRESAQAPAEQIAAP